MMTGVMLRTLALCALAAAAYAQPTHYLVLQKAASSVAWYTTKGKLVHTVSVGQHPHEMVFSKDRTHLYTTDNGTMKIEHAGSGGNTVSVINLPGKARVKQIELGNFRRPHGIDLDPETGWLAITTELPDRLLIIDPGSGKIVRDYDTKGKTSHMVKLGPKAQYAYVSNSNSANVSAIRLSDGEVKLIPAGARPEGSVLSPDGKELFVCNREGESITVIDTTRNEVVATIATGKGPVRIEITPDGSTLVYALMHDQRIGFADVASRKETGTVSLKGAPVSLHLSPDGKKALAGAEDSDEIYVVSVDGKKVQQTIFTAAGAGPDPVMEFKGR